MAAALADSENSQEHISMKSRFSRIEFPPKRLKDEALHILTVINQIIVLLKVNFSQIGVAGKASLDHGAVLDESR
jgi:hypothetical protein